MTKPEAIILKNKHLQHLGMWLLSLTLPGKESLERTKFVEILNVGISDLEKVRLELVDEFAERDELGEKKIVQKPTQFGKEVNAYDMGKNQKAFDEAAAEVLNRDFAVPIKDNVTTLAAIRGFLTRESVQGSIALQHKEWCEAFKV